MELNQTLAEEYGLRHDVCSHAPRKKLPACSLCCYADLFKASDKRWLPECSLLWFGEGVIEMRKRADGIHEAMIGRRVGSPAVFMRYRFRKIREQCEMTPVGFGRVVGNHRIDEFYD